MKIDLDKLKTAMSPCFSAIMLVLFVLGQTMSLQCNHSDHFENFESAAVSDDADDDHSAEHQHTPELYDVLAIDVAGHECTIEKTPATFATHHEKNIASIQFEVLSFALDDIRASHQLGEVSLVLPANSRWSIQHRKHIAKLV